LGRDQVLAMAAQRAHQSSSGTDLGPRARSQ
jgi:hypothetical protein